MWIVRLLDLLNIFAHSVHLKGLSLSWILACTFSNDLSSDTPEHSWSLRVSIVSNFQKKMEDEKPKESECDVKRPSGPIFAFYYISDGGFNSYWPVQRLDDGYRVHSEHYVWVFPSNPPSLEKPHRDGRGQIPHDVGEESSGITTLRGGWKANTMGV